MFIILHRAEHRPIYINPKYISKMEATGPFQQAQNPNWTTALTVDGQTVYVTETIDEILIKEDAGFPVLDTVTASNFAFASSHSLRSTDLFNIIPHLKFLQKQNNLFGLIAAFNFIFSHQSKFRNFFNKMTQPALVTLKQPLQSR